MSRSNQFTKKFSTGIGNPVGEFIKEIDMATIGATEDVKIFDEFSWSAYLVSCQVISEGLTGVLNGTVDLLSSNDGENYDLLSVQTALTTANDSNTLERVEFSGKYTGAKITKGTITGGIVRLHFIVKTH